MNKTFMYTALAVIVGVAVYFLVVQPMIDKAKEESK